MAGTSDKSIIERLETELAHEKQERGKIEARLFRLRALTKPDWTIEANTWIYIATSPLMARQFHFKPGITDNLRKRLSTYNSGRPSGDMMYYACVWKCFYARNMENSLRYILRHFIDTHDKEIVIIPFPMLERIMNSMVACDNQVGNSLRTYVACYDKYFESDYVMIPRVTDLDNGDRPIGSEKLLLDVCSQTDSSGANTKPRVGRDPVDCFIGACLVKSPMRNTPLYEISDQYRHWYHDIFGYIPKGIDPQVIFRNSLIGNLIKCDTPSGTYRDYYVAGIRIRERNDRLYECESYFE